MMKVVPNCIDALHNIKPGELRGRTVLITGGGSGFGRQLSIMCATAGADVVTGDLNVNGLQGTAALCEGLSGTCRFPTGPTDVALEASLRGLFEYAQQIFGRPADVVVVNAGVTEVGRLSQDVVQRNELGRFPKEPRLLTLDVNFAGALLTAKLAEEFWQQDSSGERNRQLVYLASMGGHSGIPGAPLYSASKHGLIGLWTAQCARIQRSKTPSFSCYAICPFFSFTGILDKTVLLGLAGLSTVKPDTVASTVMHIVRDIKEEHGPGSMFCVPDHCDPLQYNPEEHGPLDRHFYLGLTGAVKDRQKIYHGPEYVESRNNDIFTATGVNRANLFFICGALAYILWQIGKLWRAVGPAHLLVIGILLAAMKDKNKRKIAA